MSKEFNDVIDTREQQAITEARFFTPYKAELHELFTALGREHLWSDDPQEMLPYIRSGWIGQEHGNSTEKDQFTDEQVAAALPVLNKLGLVQEMLPPDGAHFDRAIVLGGTLQADMRRGKVVFDAITEHGVTADVIDIWDGQRPREARDGMTGDMLSADGRFAGNDIVRNPWLVRAVERGAFGDPWEMTEKDLGRIAVLKTWGGNLVPHRINLPLKDLLDPRSVLPRHEVVLDDVGEPKDTIPPRLAHSYEFTTENGQHIVLQNAVAVDRGKDGKGKQLPPRHTTRSSAVEWLRHNDIPEGARVLFSTSNPHTVRTAQDTYKVLQEQGRGDIQLTVAGASAPDNAPIQMFLGEVGRLIDNDVKRNYEA